MPPDKKRPNVFAYADFRTFLKDWYQQAHQEDPKFSHRFIAAKLGFASGSWFNDLLKGRSSLKGVHLVKLAGLMKLKENEADYLEALVHYNQAGSVEERNRCFRKLMSFKEAIVDLVGPDKFKFYSKWYYTAIRESLFIREFTGDYDSLAKNLRPSIKPSQAKEAIELLERLAFIRKDAQGVYRPQAVILKKDPTFKSLYAANFLLDTMELGMQALEEFSKEERNISALTLSLSKEGFHKANYEIESLRKKLMTLMASETNPEKVYQCNLQFFPVTR